METNVFGNKSQVRNINLQIRASVSICVSASASPLCFRSLPAPWDSVHQSRDIAEVQTITSRCAHETVDNRKDETSIDETNIWAGFYVTFILINFLVLCSHAFTGNPQKGEESTLVTRFGKTPQQT